MASRGMAPALLYESQVTCLRGQRPLSLGPWLLTQAWAGVRAGRAAPAGPSGKTARQPSLWGPASQGSAKGCPSSPSNLYLQQGETRAEKSFEEKLMNSVSFV